jgi:hypothetical protein
MHFGFIIRTVKIFISAIRPPSFMTSKARYDAPGIGIIVKTRKEVDQS